MRTAFVWQKKGRECNDNQFACRGCGKMVRNRRWRRQS